MSEIVEEYKPGMFEFYPDGVPYNVRKNIFEEKLAILKKFGHEDFEPQLRKKYKIDD